MPNYEPGLPIKKMCRFCNLFKKGNYVWKVECRQMGEPNSKLWQTSINFLQYVLYHPQSLARLLLICRAGRRSEIFGVHIFSEKETKIWKYLHSFLTFILFDSKQCKIKLGFVFQIKWPSQNFINTQGLLN